MDAELALRPAQPGDRPAMERVCAQTFEWGDYIPEVWDDWLADEQGLVLVGELGGTVAALSKVTFQTPEQVWLEGMRVDPAYRLRGIAGRFLDYSIAYARQRGARVVRLGTSHHNTAVHHMVTRAGMERVGSYALRAAEPLAGDARPSFLTPEFGPEARAFLTASAVLAHTCGLCSFGWAWQELSTELLSRFLEGGQVTAQFTADRRLAALAPIRFDPDDKRLWIGFADGQPGAVVALAAALRAHAAQIGAQKVQVMLPDLPWLRDAFRSAGYGPGDWEGELWIFERTLIHKSPALAGGAGHSQPRDRRHP
jgi:GNAT superfamily N-acetyltransferase